MGSTTESLTQKWLRQNIQTYVQPDAVYAHVDAVLARYQSIRPKTDVYTYDDGRTQLLLCIHGLLPISYRGTAYNIPIAVWVPREYPRFAPMAYVVPTSDMLVKAGKHMEVSGRCQIEYIQNWQRKSEGCNLAAMFEVMQEHFSREPPVYAKPKAPASPPPQGQPRRSESTQPDYSARPPPPVPGARPTSSPLSRSASILPGGNDDRPPLPVRPGMSSAFLPPAVSPATHPHLGIRTQPSSVIVPPALSGRPHGIADPGLPQYMLPSLPPQYAIHERSSASPTARLNLGPPATTGLVLNSPGPAVWSPSPGSMDEDTSRSSIASYAVPGRIPSQSTNHFQTLSHPPPPPPLPVSSPEVTQPEPQAPRPYLPPFLSPQSTGGAHIHPPPPPPTLGYSHSVSAPAPAPRPPVSIPPPDLLDAEDDDSTLSVAPTRAPAPPRPPNPELVRLHDQVHAKLSSELASLSQAMALDAERLRAHQTDLLAGEPAIRDEMARLEAVRDVCRGVSGRTRAVVEDAERNVAELKRKGDPDVDELVCSTTIVHNQLINLVAEDNAIEDTIYHLHRALNAGRIDLERFIRTARILAEEQFTKRALIEKILGGIPMGESAYSVREWS